ncbi:DUF7681 family protein [Cupriavidus sp. 30B13]|uniref:Acb2/Tad1 domain-containing protein n=1 Tax=Cupriavidus sp. 30B13 TaxID=3384241 RepID=UPI003B8FADDD
MDNQHRRIAGYRELTQDEIDLMNRIKLKGAELLALHGELAKLLNGQSADLVRRLNEAGTSDAADAIQSELERRAAAEPHRWASIGKTDIETGVMALVRAVAQPAAL